MRAAFREYRRLLVRLWWQVFIGVGCGVVGASKDMEVIDWPIPSWVWYFLAIGAVVVAQFLAFYTVHKEVAAHRAAPKHDVFLYAVFDYVYKQIIKDAAVSDPIKVTTNRIVEKGITGEI